MCATLVVIELEIVRGDHGGGRDEREEIDGSGHVRGWMRRPEVRERDRMCSDGGKDC